MTEIAGNIHSIDNCSTCEGPGVRLVVNVQGCPMRCLDCLKPEMQDFNVNLKMTASDIIKIYEQKKEFLTNGGITLAGGEPLLQIDFAIELFKLAKEKGVHTTLSTSGVLYSKEKALKIDELLKYTDLVILTFKHVDDAGHNKLTGHSVEPIFHFTKHCSDKKMPLFIRHTVIPNITLNKTYLMTLGGILGTLSNVAHIEILPYRAEISKKYEDLDKQYQLKDIPSLTQEDLQNAKTIVLEAMQKIKVKA